MPGLSYLRLACCLGRVVCAVKALDVFTFLDALGALHALAGVSAYFVGAVLGF